MSKIGRNDPCHCGSGKKYKRCCKDQDEATELLALTATRTQIQEQGAEFKAQFNDFKAHLFDENEPDELATDSNAVIDLIKAGQLDEAERAARELLVRYPEVHDGHDRLGMVYEARGQNREAADCYRRALEHLRTTPDSHDPEFETVFEKLIARLDPPGVSSQLQAEPPK